MERKFSPGGFAREQLAAQTPGLAFRRLDRGVALRGPVSRGLGRGRMAESRGQRLSRDHYRRRRVSAARHRVRGQGPRAGRVWGGPWLANTEPTAIQFL